VDVKHVLKIGGQTLVMPPVYRLVPPHRPLPTGQADDRLEIHHGPKPFQMIHHGISHGALSTSAAPGRYEQTTVLFQRYSVPAIVKHCQALWKTSDAIQRDFGTFVLELEVWLTCGVPHPMNT
jgi:hypothetical protein